MFKSSPHHPHPRPRRRPLDALAAPLDWSGCGDGFSARPPRSRSTTTSRRASRSRWPDPPPGVRPEAPDRHAVHQQRRPRQLRRRLRAPTTPRRSTRPRCSRASTWSAWIHAASAPALRCAASPTRTSRAASSAPCPRSRSASRRSAHSPARRPSSASAAWPATASCSTTSRRPTWRATSTGCGRLSASPSSRSSATPTDRRRRDLREPVPEPGAGDRARRRCSTRPPTRAASARCRCASAASAGTIRRAALLPRELRRSRRAVRLLGRRPGRGVRPADGPDARGSGLGFTYAQAVERRATTLSFPPAWPSLAQDLAAVRDGAPAARLAALADDEYDDSQEALTSIVCSETDNPRDPRSGRSPLGSPTRSRPTSARRGRTSRRRARPGRASTATATPARSTARPSAPLLLVNARYDAFSSCSGRARSPSVLGSAAADRRRCRAHARRHRQRLRRRGGGALPGRRQAAAQGRRVRPGQHAVLDRGTRGRTDE